jgi:tetratricopeptide (TPR) repeat protein
MLNELTAQTHDGSVSFMSSTRPQATAMAAKPARRRWFFRLVAILLVPVFGLAALEGALRLAGFGFPTSFFVKTRIGGKEYLVNNDSFVLRFFPPEKARRPRPAMMEASKEANACRIFVMGESAAVGDPDPAYGAPRYLQVLLRDRFPALHFEVVNVAITAINSHAILPIARECARRQGDLWIIYMGNNEMVGPFGAASVFGSQAPPWPIVRLSLQLQRTRLGQWLMAWARRFQEKKPSTSSWGGLEMFLENRVRPDDPRKEIVYRNFQRNLDDILRAGLDSGTKVILNTVAVNLRDCPPLASVSATNISAAQRTQCDLFYANGCKSEKEGQFDQAAEFFSQAARIDPLRADAHYQWADSLLRMTNLSEARRHFALARDCDALPARTDSRINGIIRDAARKWAAPGLVFFDAAATLGSNCVAGICGDETFYEHVHFNFDGNYRLARAWAEQVEGLLPSNVRQSAAPSWLSQEICEHRLGLTDWNRRNDLAEILSRRQSPPLNQQDNNAQQSQSLREEIALLSRRMDAGDAAAARAIYLDAIARAPEDFDLYSNFADFLSSIGALKEALIQWETLEQLMPFYFLPYFQEGRLRERQGELAAARSAFAQALALHPGMAPAWYELGNIDASQGHYDAALKEVDRAAQLEPAQGVFQACAGKLLSKMNRPQEAIARYRQAVEVQPDYLDGHISLGAALAADGKTGDAKNEFLAVLRLDPANKTAQAYLGQMDGLSAPPARPKSLSPPP